MIATEGPTVSGVRSALVILIACSGTAVALWLLPATVQIATWPDDGPGRIALFAPLARLWIALGAAAIGGALLLAVGTHERWPARAQTVAPLMLLWLWALPFVPWLPDRLPVLLLVAGPARWVVAAVALGGAAVAWVRSRSPRLPAMLQPRRRLVFIGMAVLYSALGLRALAAVGLGGDEPHYLVITHSLLADHDLKIENNHARGDYRNFFDGVLRPDYLRRGLNGEIYSIHSPGLAVLLLPGYAAAGARGAVVTMCLIAACAALAMYELAVLLGGPAVGLLTCVSVCFTVPFIPHAWMLYPETACAAIVAWTVLWLARPEPSRPLVWLARGAALAALPWLHTKFIVLLLALAAFGVWPLRNRLKEAAAFSLPLVASLAGWLSFFYVIYGSIDPQVAYGSYTGQYVRFENVPRSLLGLLVDQKFGLLIYSPVYLFALTGFRFLWKRPAWRAWSAALIVAAVPYVISSSRLYMWWGGASAPARFLVPIVPLLAPLLAAQFHAGRGRLARATVMTCVALSVLFAMVGAVDPKRGLLFSDPHGYARILESIQGSAPIAALLPTFTEENWIRPAFLAGKLAACTAFALVAGALAAARAQRLSGLWIAAIEAAVFVIVGNALFGPPGTAARSDAVLRGRASLMEAYDPGRLRGFDYVSMAKLDPSSLIRATSLIIRRPLDAPVDAQGRVAGPVTLPPGSYQTQVWFHGSHPQPGDLILSPRRGGALVRASGPLANPAAVAFQPLVPMAVWVALTDRSAAGAVDRIEITPMSIVPRSDRLEASVRAIEAIPGRASAYIAYLDDNAYPEGGTFWTRADARGTVLIAPAGASNIRLTLHVGPIQGTVRIAAADRPFNVEMAPNETRPLSIPVAPGSGLVPLSVQAPGWFRPAEVEPHSNDVRQLGCQVRVELQ